MKQKNILLKWVFSSALFGALICGSPAHAANLDTRLGAEAANEIEEQMGLATHATATAYIEKLGQRLVSQLGDQPFDYEFHIVDTKEPNAFALPGGFVYFSRGIILIANSEEELAGVMGHEIIHAHKRHSVKAIRRNVVPGILKLPGNIVGSVLSGRLGRLINLPVEGVTGLTLSRYGRKQETQADRLGAELAAKSGYDPKALGVILTNLTKVDELLTGEKEKFSYYDGHPFTPKRVKDINKISKKLKVSSLSPMASNKKEFFEKFDGLQIGGSPSQGLFYDNKFVQPDLNFALVFPEGWETINSPSHVGAYEPNKEAQLFLGLAGNAGDPEKPARKFLRELKKKHRTKPTESRTVNLNGNPGYYVSIKDNTAKQPMTLHLLWISMGKHMFEFIGTGYEKHKLAMRESVLSLHPISEEEWKDVVIPLFRMAEANEGETLKSLSKRSGNSLSLELTAAINDLSPDQKLSKGQLIKIGKKEPYRPSGKRGSIR